ncbi:GNAT family N-acetyltransferase [Trinickia fusca]|uniref:N-acetyltransferase n=1 Tax=Trinickia fusca TaxID=2419777 RepID=A0A494X2N4_9BURK|nr:GNAT family N-acetyltransferase [Trinickia fusca]RKP44965.1 N-acetyltransferase [Trinickia fusca]
MKQERIDYRMGLLTSPSEVDAGQWNALVAQEAQPTPFLRHEFLSALTATQCATERTGWAPRFLTLVDTRTDRLAAAAPLYLKSHSYGEYVFDWAWADAYQRNGLDYYPKLVCAVPFTPVQGARLLAVDEHARRQLAASLVALAEQSDVSSLHVLFPTEDETQALTSLGMMRREGVQFHWLNDGYRHFDDFLSTLEQKKRKNIRAERRKVHEAGVTFRRVRGQDATHDDWRFFHRCYKQTYREHFSSPYLNLEFFRTIAQTMPENLLLVIAEREGRPIASSLVIYQRDAQTGGTLYGRYWGALEHVPCLHFETAYYQPLEFCIEEKLAVFEGGAQGEHKMARGFMPTVTRSAHWLAHPAFSDAVARFLENEANLIHAHVDELREHDPFKR